MTPGHTPSTLPEPGEVQHTDYRSLAVRPQGSHAAAPHSPPARGCLTMVQWNIERGYELELVIQQLQQLDADIIALQEVDVGCERSGSVDTGAAIAQALGLQLLFVPEFVEIRSPLRDARSQGGGVHGNAILSKLDFTGWGVVEHSHQPIDWSAPPAEQPHPLAAREPRRGRRLTLYADVALAPGAAMRVYSCHLEVFCGMLSRVWQFSDILQHVRHHHQQQVKQQTQQMQQQQQQQQPEHEQQHMQQPQRWCYAILGDLNTMGHSVARLSPNYCCDAMRWRSLGWSEAAWWQRHVLSVTDPCPVNKHLLRLGLPPEVAAAAVNPGFVDPFDVETETLNNPKYCLVFGRLSLMAGKLDWVLLRGCRVVRTAMGNDDFAASDHRWLAVEVAAV